MPYTCRFSSPTNLSAHSTQRAFHTYVNGVSSIVYRLKTLSVQLSAHPMSNAILSFCVPFFCGTCFCCDSYQIERVNGALPAGDDSSFPFKAVLRQAVLMCVGKRARGPHLEKSGDGGEDLRLNLPSRQGTRTTYHQKGDASLSNTTGTRGLTSGSRSDKGGGASGISTPVKTVLLVKGKWVRKEC